MNLFNRLLPVITAYADDVDPIVSGIVAIQTKVFNLAKGVLQPLCIIVVIVAGIQIAIAGSPQEVAAAKKRLLYAALGWLVVYLAPKIVETLQLIQI